jgi:hypothetical protein
MLATATVVVCRSCGRWLARDHTETICSPCRRTTIENSAYREALIARDRTGIKAAFDSSGLYGVAQHLDSTPEEALDAVIRSQLIPVLSAPRRALLHQLVRLRDSSHVAVAEALHISRWTVAAYRRQLGIDRIPHRRSA